MLPIIARILALSIGTAVALTGCVPPGPPGPTATATAAPDPQASRPPTGSDAVAAAAAALMSTLTANGSDAAARERAMVGQSDLFTAPVPLPSPSPANDAPFPRISDSRQVASNSDGSRTVTVVHREDHGLWDTTETARLTAVIPDRPLRYDYARTGSNEFGAARFARLKVWDDTGTLRQATISYDGSQGDSRTGPGSSRTTIEAQGRTLSAAEETYTGTAVQEGRTFELGLLLQPGGGTITLTDPAAGVMVRNSFDAQWRLSPAYLVVEGGRSFDLRAPF